jgi:outer membrane murein-binding lipoprotein Lpp
MIEKGVTMRLALAGAVCAVALFVGCSAPPEQKDPRLAARDLYLNSLADGCDKDASLLREQAMAYEIKAKEKLLKAKELRRKAKLAGEGKLVEPEESKDDQN